MLRHVIIVALCCLVQVLRANEDSPRVVIVGCGASAIAAATRLMQNGFNNVTILEAEDRIGGRVYTTEFGGYLVDVGGQWVHGEEGNVVYEMASPLGLVERSEPEVPPKMYTSSGDEVNDELVQTLMDFFHNASNTVIPEEYKTKSVGDYMEPKLEEFYKAHPEITKDQQQSFTRAMDLYSMAYNAAPSWYNLSTDFEYEVCKGDNGVNWKDKGYSTVIDILTKKIPNPEEELPLVNNTKLNTEVTNIKYDNPDGIVRVVTANGDEYSADHVIVTPSIAVLKDDHEKLFTPRLTDTKINAMKGLQLGRVVKIYLKYDEPWWTTDNKSLDASWFFSWTEKDKNEIANDPEKAWMLSLSYISGAAHKPKLLMVWLVGTHAYEFESIPEERAFNDIKAAIRRFYGKKFTLTEPTAMLRSNWYSNKHFRGTWSNRSPLYRQMNTKLSDLYDPIMENGKPAVMFAGEVTHPTHYSTVHGAIESGWREADRIMEVYKNKKPSTATS